MEKPFSAYEGDEPFTFVCYAHHDEEVVYADIARLHEQGINLWYDEGISAGTVWRQKIAASIENADKFLYFISPASLASEHCNREIYYAVDKGIEVIPVYLEETQLTQELELTLARVQALQRYQDKDYERHLLDALKRQGPPTRGGVLADRGRPSIGNRGLLIAVVAAVLVLGVVAGYFSMRPDEGTAPDEQISELSTPTLHVKDFTTFDGDAGLKRYAAIVTQDIKDALGKHETLAVVGPGSTAEPRFIVSGNLRSIGEGVRASIELLSTNDDLVIWSDSLDDRVDVQHVFEFERSAYIAYSVNTMVQYTGYRSFLEQIGASDNPLAMNAFFAGMTENSAARVGDGNYRVAIDHFRRAIALDPSFTEPHAMLTLIYAIRAQGAVPFTEAREGAHELIEKMRPLMRTPLVSYALAYVNLRLDLNYDEALKHILDAEASSFYQSYQMQMVKCQIAWARGDLNESISLCAGAAATGGSLEWYILGNLLYLAGRYRDAADAMARSLQISDTSQTKDKERGVHDNLGFQLLDVMARSQFLAGDTAGAAATLDSDRAREFGRFPRKYATSLVMLGRIDEAQKALELIDAAERSGESIEPVERFWPYFYLNDRDKAFHWLNQAIESRDVFMIGVLRASPQLDSLREDPRFAAALVRVEEIEAQARR